MTLQARDAYLERAAEAGLAMFAERSWGLYQRFPFEQAPRQSPGDIVETYERARRLAAGFASSLRECEERLNVQSRLRPGDVKDANRTIEKMSGGRRDVPLDLLGGTLICSSLTQAYAVAEDVTATFTVVSFRDRHVVPVPSGYRDLQFSVKLEGEHIAELKILHRMLADLDQYEHRIFEVQRSIEARHRDEMPFIEGLVVKSLTTASNTMYTQAWKRILVTEGLLGQTEDENDD